MNIEGFDWDEGNRTKCARHGLSIAEIEQFFRGEIQILGDQKHSQRETRFIAAGMTGHGRPMFVGFTFRRKGKLLLIRPISARYMHEKEALKYAQAAS
jgi:uncharacterized protein